jgi:hypothetical protein
VVDQAGVPSSIPCQLELFPLPIRARDYVGWLTEEDSGYYTQFFKDLGEKSKEIQEQFDISPELNNRRMGMREV